MKYDKLAIQGCITTITFMTMQFLQKLGHEIFMKMIEKLEKGEQGIT